MKKLGACIALLISTTHLFSFYTDSALLREKTGKRCSHQASQMTALLVGVCPVQKERFSKKMVNPVNQQVRKCARFNGGSNNSDQVTDALSGRYFSDKYRRQKAAGDQKSNNSSQMQGIFGVKLVPSPLARSNSFGGIHTASLSRSTSSDTLQTPRLISPTYDSSQMKRVFEHSVR